MMRIVMHYCAIPGGGAVDHHCRHWICRQRCCRRRHGFGTRAAASSSSRSSLSTTTLGILAFIWLSPTGCCWFWQHDDVYVQRAGEVGCGKKKKGGRKAMTPCFKIEWCAPTPEASLMQTSPLRNYPKLSERCLLLCCRRLSPLHASLQLWKICY